CFHHAATAYSSRRRSSKKRLQPWKPWKLCFFRSGKSRHGLVERELLRVPRQGWASFIVLSFLESLNGILLPDFLAELEGLVLLEGEGVEGFDARRSRSGRDCGRGCGGWKSSSSSSLLLL
ncbi:hypothetical protein PIB30_076683, partial [Stylosanthes scabra]|nr:hypothetical protein [Stylosanthes scabra]